MATLKTSQTTRPGWLWVRREKKLLHASEPAYALVTLILICDNTTNAVAVANARVWLLKT